MATIVDNLNNIEIVQCTARSADTLTVVRGQEGATPARALNAGDKIENRLTAGTLIAVRDQPADPNQIPDQSITGRMLAPLSITNGKYALASISTPQLFDGGVTAPKLAPGAALSNLGYTPVQQGGGAGQGTNKVYIGWTASSKLALQVDSSNLGFILTERQDGTGNSAGYRALYPTGQNNDYTFGVIDNGRSIYHGVASPNVYYIPTDSVAMDVGAVIHIVNFPGAGVVTIAPSSGVVLAAIPGGANGNRLLAGPGVATIEKISANYWIIYGAGLT